MTPINLQLTTAQLSAFEYLADYDEMTLQEKFNEMLRGYCEAQAVYEEDENEKDLPEMDERRIRRQLRALLGTDEEDLLT